MNDEKIHFSGEHHFIKDLAQYQAMYKQSIEDPETFWGEVGKRIHWSKPYSKVYNASFDGEHSIKWFEDGELNACYNCIDRHLPAKANDTAITWETIRRLPGKLTARC